MAWWKYGSQPDQPFRDVNPTVNSGGFSRTQSTPKPVYIPTNGRRPTSTAPISASNVSQSVRNELKTGPVSVSEIPLPGKAYRIFRPLRQSNSRPPLSEHLFRELIQHQGVQATSVSENLSLRKHNQKTAR